jgi:hypothetical protein
MVAKFIAKTVQKSVRTDGSLATIHPIREHHRGGDGGLQDRPPVEIKFIFVVEL